MKKIKVGLVGYGTIGAALAEAVKSRFSREAQLAYIYDHRLANKVSLETLIHKSDLVIEAASASISGEIARHALKQNKQVLVMSVGGLLDAPEVFFLAKHSRGKLWVPSGAVAGIDGISAAKEGGIKSVKLVTRKPPKGLNQAPYFKTHKFPALKGNQEVRVFKGNTFAAVKGFPQNINVAAVLSLAGIGAEKTQVEIWTSNAYTRNRHEITAEGKFGKITTVCENVPSPDNPKTSALAIYSAIATLRKIFSTVRIGT